jgi:hypothetical protein
MRSVSDTLLLAAASASSGPSDPFFSSVSLLLHADGTNGSTTFPDNSPIAHTLTANGNAQVSTTLPKFGTGSLLLDGSGDDLSIPASTSLAFGTGSFTMEAFIKTTAFQSCYIFGQRAFGGFHMGVLADGRFFGISPALNSIAEPSVSMVEGTWYHVAYTRDTSSIVRIFVNGVVRASNTNTEDGSATGTSYVGQTGFNDRYFNGRIDELRLTKGVCRYTADFTPPIDPFPNS